MQNRIQLQIKRKNQDFQTLCVYEIAQHNLAVNTMLKLKGRFERVRLFCAELEQPVMHEKVNRRMSNANN